MGMLGGSNAGSTVPAIAQINRLTMTGPLARSQTNITYSASMTPDASAGELQVITVTNNSAMTINAPTNPTTNQFLTIRVANTSGGAMGVITWNGAFKIAGWTNPATGFSRMVTFYYNSVAWIQVSVSAQDVPN